MKRYRSLPLLFICLWITLLAVGQPVSAQTIKSNDVVILYENDVHCNIDGYAKMAGLRDQVKKQTKNVCVVSCGDFISGNIFGASHNGEYIIDIMNAVGYDFITLGNHEFDYRIPQLMKLTSKLKATTLSCNFRKIEDNQSIFKGVSVYWYKTGGVAFIGVSTPETITSSTPAYFMNKDKQFVYTFSQDSLYAIVQNMVTIARDLEGADHVVVLSHLGDVGANPTSLQLIANTTGIDVVLDGHAHSVIPQQIVLNKVGEPVLLSSTGTAFENIGELIISKDKSGKTDISSALIPTNQITPNKKMSKKVNAIKEEIAASGRTVVGHNAVTLSINDEKGTKRLIRRQECGLGDFCADAYRAVLNADIGLCNGGGIRADLPAGEVTRNSILAVFPFNSQASVGQATGQAILDALEMTARRCSLECGGFAQVSGLKYDVDTTIASPVVLDANGVFVSVDGPRRVKNVQVLDKNSNQYVPIQPDKKYTIASSSYILRDNGDGVVFRDIELLLEDDCSDAEILERYIRDFLKGEIGTQYATPQGRINMLGK